ncbi:hypothetical protein D3C78_1774770 [compost metagenome]
MPIEIETQRKPTVAGGSTLHGTIEKCVVAFPSHRAGDKRGADEHRKYLVLEMFPQRENG